MRALGEPEEGARALRRLGKGVCAFGEPEEGVHALGSLEDGVHDLTDPDNGAYDLEELHGGGAPGTLPLPLTGPDLTCWPILP